MPEDQRPNVCAMCQQPEAEARLGNFYDAISPNGMRLIHFWVCNDCAIPLGPDQGGIAADLRDQRKNC